MFHRVREGNAVYTLTRICIIEDFCLLGKQAAQSQNILELQPTWECSNCGCIEDKIVDRCPVCGAGESCFSKKFVYKKNGSIQSGAP